MYKNSRGTEINQTRNGSKTNTRKDTSGEIEEPHYVTIQTREGGYEERYTVGNSYNCLLQGNRSRQIPHPRTAPTHAQYTEVLHGEATAFQTSTQVLHPVTITVPPDMAQEKAPHATYRSRMHLRRQGEYKPNKK